MKSAYDHKLEQQHFQVVRTIKTPNLEKLRIMALYARLKTAADTFAFQQNAIARMNSSTGPKVDSLAYYRAMLNKPDFYDKYVLLNEDSLMATIDTDNKSFFFTGKLHIIYNDKGRYNQSEIYLATPEPLKMDSRGGYYPPQELVTIGYWALHEKIANEIPVDYVIDDH